MKGNLWGDNGFSLIVAMEPPKGTDLELIRTNCERLKGRVDAVFFGDSPDAIMRMSPTAVCCAVSELGLRSVMGINCRDRNRLAIQGDLLSAWNLGITDVVVEDGKDPSYGDHSLTKPVRDIDCAQTLETLSRLNQGKDLAGGPLRGNTQFSMGAWVEWLDNDAQVDKEFTRMAILAQAGAQAFFVSPQFDMGRAKELIKRAKPLGAAIFIGVMLLKSVGMARYLNEVPGVSNVPDDVIKKMTTAPVKQKAGVELAAEFIKELEGEADGVVLMPLGWEHKVPGVLDILGR